MLCRISAGGGGATRGRERCLVEARALFVFAVEIYQLQLICGSTPTCTSTPLQRRVGRTRPLKGFAETRGSERLWAITAAMDVLQQGLANAACQPGSQPVSFPALQRP